MSWLLFCSWVVFCLSEEDSLLTEISKKSLCSLGASGYLQGRGSLLGKNGITSHPGGWMSAQQVLIVLPSGCSLSYNQQLCFQPALTGE